MRSSRLNFPVPSLTKSTLSSAPGMKVSRLSDLNKKVLECLEVSMVRFSEGYGGREEERDYSPNAKPQMGTWIDRNVLLELTNLLNDTSLDNQNSLATYMSNAPISFYTQLLHEEGKYSLTLFHAVGDSKGIPPRRHDPGTILIYKPLYGSGRLKSTIGSRLIQEDLMEVIEESYAGAEMPSESFAFMRIGGPVRKFEPNPPVVGDFAELPMRKPCGSGFLELAIYPPQYNQLTNGGDSVANVQSFFLESFQSISLINNQSQLDSQQASLEQNGVDYTSGIIRFDFPEDQINDILTSYVNTLVQKLKKEADDDAAKAAIFHSLQTGYVNTSFSYNNVVVKRTHDLPYDMLTKNIGGLDEELRTIIRRIFLTRRLHPDSVRALGLGHVRGLLLYGAPGCGKTLIAREIAKLLNAREPVIVNGPEILDKYVGQAEQNIRDLFRDSEEEWDRLGWKSELHVIVFDEFDAIAKRRGSMIGDGSGVRDSCVNQLLSKLDGMSERNNVLVIATTNRKDLIEPALLRPGRLEVHLEIRPPSREGREEILFILFQSMVSGGLLSLNEAKEWVLRVSDRTEGWTGADLAGLVRCAASIALDRAMSMYDERMEIPPEEENDYLAGIVKLQWDDIDMAVREINKSRPRESIFRKMKNYPKRFLSKLIGSFDTKRKDNVKSRRVLDWEGLPTTKY